MILSPTLETVWNSEPEAIPFRQTIDTNVLKVPKCPKSSEKPIDLSVIKRKLDSLSYHDPWDFIEDINLIFENALLNKSNTKVYRFASKVS